MGSFGEKLRREREMRGISLDEIATATKISARNLRALEEEKFEQLPGGIFNKGFVRAYARFLGIDEEHIVSEYVAASQDTEDAREEKLKAEFSKPEFKKDADQEISLEPKSQWGTIAAIVLIAVLAFGGWQVYQKKKAERMRQRNEQPVHVQPPPSSSAILPNSSAVQNQTAPTGTMSTAQNAVTDSTTPEQPSSAQNSSSTQTPVPAAQKPSPDQGKDQPKTDQKSSTDATPPPINIKLKLTQPSWVEIKSDGKVIFSDNLPSGAERTVTGHDKVEMKLGNSGGVELTYNGKPVENLSKGQDVRRITFTPSGYE